MLHSAEQQSSYINLSNVAPTGEIRRCGRDVSQVIVSGYRSRMDQIRPRYPHQMASNATSRLTAEIPAYRGFAN
jgi:hypothetical protein